MTKFGKYGADGAVETEADECVLTGRKLTAPFDTTVRYRVAGTPLFYRVLGSQAHRLTDEMRAELDAETTGGAKAAPEFFSNMAEVQAVETAPPVFSIESTPRSRRGTGANEPIEVKHGE